MMFFDHIDDYKNGLLTGEPLRLFEEELKNDVDLRAAVENYGAAKGISEGLLELDVMEVIEGLAPVKQEIKKSFTLRKFLVAASVVGVLVFGWRQITKKRADANNLFTNLYKEENPLRQYRGNGEPDKADITPIQKEITRYAKKEKSLTEVKQFFLDSIENKALGKLWVAELFLEQRQIDSTLFYLPSPSILPEQKNRIFYIKMLVAVKKGDLVEAREYLYQLPKESYRWLYRGYRKELGLNRN